MVWGLGLFFVGFGVGFSNGVCLGLGVRRVGYGFLERVLIKGGGFCFLVVVGFFYSTFGFF